MKNFLFTFLFTLCFTALFASSGYQVDFNQPTAGTYELQFNLSDYDLTQVNLDGQNFTKILFEGSIFTNLKGYAELPYLSASVQLSAEKNVTLKVIEGDYVEYNVTQPMLPSRGVIYRNQDPSSVPYEIAPSSMRDAWYPQQIAKNATPFIIRDLRGTTVYVYPFRYNPVQQVLRVYKNVTVQLVENNSTPVNPLANQSSVIEREMDPIYQSLFINYNTAKDLTIGEYGDILVICTSRDETAMAPYVQWKREKGFNVSIETVATGTNVKTNVQNAYANNNDLLYVQLVGDWADIKCDMLSGYAPMDPQLGCVVGTDQEPDICIGRFSGNSADQITVQVNKVIEYEKNPDMGATWYTSALGVASNQGPGDDNELDYEHINVIYNDKLDPFTYESFSTAYDPTGTAQMVANAINSGVSIINYCGHGSETSWGSTGFSNSHINQLTNGNKLPIIFSVACVNGAFHGSSDCFAEAWLKKENGGAVMTMMSTINQPWDPPMRGEDYFNDVLVGGYDYSAHPGQNGISTTEGRTTIGAITFNGLVLMTTESGTTSDYETAKTWHIFGDPSMQPRTKAPDDINLSSNVILVGAPFATTITGPNGPIEGAMVCLSQNDEYFTAVTDASGAVSITHNLSPGTAKLVVTGFNLETIYDDLTVVPPGGPYVIVNACDVDDSNGNNNGQADYGETVFLDIAAENVGSDPATGVEASVTTSDDYITLVNNNYSFGTIAAGAVVTSSGAFEIEVAEDAPDGHVAILDVEFSDDSKSSWISSATVSLHAAVMELSDYTISDNTGNNNGKIDPGETVNISIEIANNGSSDAYNVAGELSCTDPYITIVSGSQSYGDIDAGTTAQQTFSVAANMSTPAGHSVTFDLLLSGDLGLSGTESISEVVGQIPILIIDLDGNQNSSDKMMEAMASNDFIAEYADDIPADLSLYSSIFLCLGIYTENHVLSQTEGQALADFLNNGGNLYMEGGDTWYFDDQTAVHGMFGVNATSDGSSDLGTVNGETGTFTEGMSFNYSGDNNYIDHIESVGGAFNILSNQSPSYGTGVAFDNGTYKTIAASHEFGGLSDGTSTKDELMAAYLEFFGFANTLQAIFTSNVTEVCESGIVEFSDMSSGDVVSWSWEFEGGTPATSTYQNPQVMYSSAGTYDVTLEVSDGTETVSVTLQDYVTVLTEPDQAATPQGDNEVCTNYTNETDYTTDGALMADTYEWMINPADAGTINGTGTTATVTWTPNWEGTATIEVKGINDCGTGAVSGAFEVLCSVCTGINENNFENISVYPNPNSGIFTVSFSSVLKNDVTLKVLNTLGSVVFKEELSDVSGNFSHSLNLSNLDKGMYFLVLENYQGNTVDRIIIR